MYVKGIAVALASMATMLIGDFDLPIKILIIFMACDYVTGIISAYHTKSLDSEVGITGITRKVVIFIVLIVANQLDLLIDIENMAFRTLTAYFYIANEGLSILENCSIIGVPIPGKLLKGLKQLKDKGNDEEQETEYIVKDE